MMQVGILCAAALVALQENLGKQSDHNKAKLLAEHCAYWLVIDGIKIETGTTFIVDRYSYSGVAFSSAKGLDFERCKVPKIGLSAPIVVVYLDISPEVVAPFTTTKTSFYIGGKPVSTTGPTPSLFQVSLYVDNNDIDQLAPVFVMQQYNVSGYKRTDVINKDSTTHIMKNPSLL
ncbi:hypothetical protein JHK86_012606 [Glycine max]|nr:hypothetical protein JHK86_012606 [Glycine max]